MNRLSIIVLLGLGLALFPARAQAQTNDTKTPPGNYYSWQHPEWPPSPTPLHDGLAVHRINQTNLPPNSFLVDDRSVEFAPSEIEANESKRLARAFNTELLLRHPEYIRSMIATYTVMLTDKETTPEAARLLRSSIADYRQLLRMSHDTPPAPYMLHEELQLRSAVLAGEQLRTNRAAITSPDGLVVNEPQFSAKIKLSAERLPQLEYQALLARQALASTNRADFENFKSFTKMVNSK